MELSLGTQDGKSQEILAVAIMEVDVSSFG